MISLRKITGFRSRAINALIDAARASAIVPSPDIRPVPSPGGTALFICRRSPSDASAPTTRLSCSISADGATLSVTAGSVRFHGIGTAAIAAKDLSCAMSPMWTSVAVSRSALSGSIVATSTEPSSDYDTLYLPLCVAESYAILIGGSSTTRWRITQLCHSGDFDFDLPMR